MHKFQVIIELETEIENYPDGTTPYTSVVVDTNKDGTATVSIDTGKIVDATPIKLIHDYDN